MRRRFSFLSAERLRFTPALLPFAKQPESRIISVLAWKFFSRSAGSALFSLIYLSFVLFSLYIGTRSVIVIAN